MRRVSVFNSVLGLYTLFSLLNVCILVFSSFSFLFLFGSSPKFSYLLIHFSLNTSLSTCIDNGKGSLEVRRRVQLEGMILVDTSLLKGQRYLSAIPVHEHSTVLSVVELLASQLHSSADGITLQSVVGGVGSRMLRGDERPLEVQRSSPMQHAFTFRLARQTAIYTGSEDVYWIRTIFGLSLFKLYIYIYISSPPTLNV